MAVRIGQPRQEGRTLTIDARRQCMLASKIGRHTDANHFARRIKGQRIKTHQTASTHGITTHIFHNRWLRPDGPRQRQEHSHRDQRLGLSFDTHQQLFKRGKHRAERETFKC
jgi:hypothetical protein